MYLIDIFNKYNFDQIEIIVIEPNKVEFFE